ncbi:MAG: ABC transporter ATP-binding protein [Planctomycetes bacterium]|nr:ABC transporter ATP-binding protein [Planctomycetota bacterium]
MTRILTENRADTHADDESAGSGPGLDTARTTQPPPAVVADSLAKCFHIYRRPADRLVEWATAGRTTRHTDFWALQDVSFSVAPGRCLGVIGENGSGKTTLIKLLAGTLYPTRGTCAVRGRTLSLMELGTGLNPQLTGRQNVQNMSRLLGLGPTHARERMAHIESFAQLGDFFDRPTALYSAGMRLRLTFSTFAAFEPDVLIIDEALSVGDVFFQQRCAARIRELLARGTTLVLVTHDMAAVQNLCDTVLLLRRGRPAFLGEPEEAVSRYLSGRNGAPCVQPHISPAGTQPCTHIDEIIAHDVIGDRGRHRHGHGGLRILAARVTSSAGRDTLAFAVGHSALITVVIEAMRPVAQPRAGIRIFDRLGNHVFGAGTAQVGPPLPPLKTGQRAIVRFEITLDLRPGPYTFGLGASEPPAKTDTDPNGALFHDSIDLLGPIQVRPPDDHRLAFFGLARLPMRVSHRVVNRD